ncbi:MAG: flotillin family protein, partial [Actinomycetota bacterium]
ARQQREVLTTIAREEAQTSVVQSEEELRARTAELNTEQKVGIEAENTQREIDVAAKNRERIVAVETERVEKARQIEVVARDVETTAAKKGLEEEMTAIADLKKSRVAVEKTVAEQEESIATLRVVEDANRHRDATVIAAEGEAQSGFVKDIKEAEAREQAASHTAKEKITLSKANLESADLDARAMTRMAEGEQAQAAAPGLADVQVREANATAIEKEGLAEVHVKEADAAAIAKVGAAEGEAMEAKLKGEAAGLTDKAAAMRELEGVGQEFEEFARRLEVEEKVKLAEVDAQVGIAKAQAEAIGKGLEQADIDIIGGTDMFVDRVVGAAATGKAVEAGFEQTALGQGYINGEKDLMDDLAALTAGMGSGGVRDLTISAFLANLMANASGDTKDGIAKLIEMAADDGIGDKPIRDIIS